MMEDFREVARVLNNRFVQKWKDEGKKVVGYTCSYVPDEIFYAAGILPYRVRGFGAGAMTIGDTYFGPFICSLPKCMLQLAGQGDFDFLDGAIITPGCDSMRRLDECWRKMHDDTKEHMPGFFFHFGVPHKYTEYSVKWFVDETRRLIRAAESHFNVAIKNEKLLEAIKVHNVTRELMNRFDEIRTRKDPPVAGADSLAIVLAGTAMPRDDYNRLLGDLVEEIGKSAKKLNGRKRLMLLGSANDDVDLVKIIEGERALVVADNLCFGSRFYSDLVSEEGDPVEELAKRSLAHNDCPRMYGEYRERLKKIKEKVATAGVDGVILQNIRFCDLHGSENGLFERDLEKEGIPCMRLEREYGPIVESGRMRMRIDAFLERLG
ncbi:MAG: 2-hydroxyacyl-CoA dehydratase [Spirochaetes bacterium]|nr:2-hydroxyacyl-CoA dehydratase [Spirochaetota bacterium]